MHWQFTALRRAYQLRDPSIATSSRTAARVFHLLTSLVKGEPTLRLPCYQSFELGDVFANSRCAHPSSSSEVSAHEDFGVWRQLVKNRRYRQRLCRGGERGTGVRSLLTQQA